MQVRIPRPLSRNMFLKHHNLITRVTLWGVADQNSWRNDWPMRGRTDYPLLFDRNYHGIHMKVLSKGKPNENCVLDNDITDVYKRQVEAI